MPTIVISYRRSDTAAIAGRVFDRLAARYGAKSVFIDVDNIPVGIDFREQIQETLSKTDVLIALIGPKWTGTDDTGGSRMQQETDPVRVEIETALKHRVPIIPVLIDGFKMPDSTALPQSFGNFAFLNATDVSTGRDFHPNVDRLVRAIDRIVSPGVEVETPGAPDPTKAAMPAVAASPQKRLLDDVLRCFLLPFVLLLAAHHAVVNAMNLNLMLLQAACAVVPLAAGFALFWLSRRGGVLAGVFALALAVVAVASMNISQGLYAGESLMPHERYEWRDAANFAAIIALSFFGGYAVAHVLRGMLARKSAKR